MSGLALSRYPHVRLGAWPTPLHALERLSAELGGPRVFVKRDDCGCFAAGGNKVRKLEFLLGAALAAGADTLITTGAVQSNHCRMTAAAAARHGLACHLLLGSGAALDTDDYREGGNVMLSRLFGAELRLLAPEEAPDDAMAALAQRLARQGRRPYTIPRGGSCLVGDLGYAACAEEMLAQARAMGICVDRVVHASGSGGTQAGLIAGFHALGADVEVLGICVRAGAGEQALRVRELAEDCAAELAPGRPLPADAVRVNDDYLGPGYGRPTPAMMDALERLARTEGLLLDPVYTGKAMAGLIDLVSRGAFASDETVVFLHTGGLPGLFAYRGALAG